MEGSYTFREFRRTVADCSEDAVKISRLYDYLNEDNILYRRYLERIAHENSIIEHNKKMNAIYEIEDDLLGRV